MAPHTNNEELRRQALRVLAESRVEISTGVDRVRQQFSPARVLHRMIDRHSGLMVLLAATAGIIPAWLMLRGRRSDHRTRLPVMIHGAKPPPKPVLGALLMGAVGVLAKAVTPALIKSAILPHVLDFLSRKQTVASQNKRAE
jgi:hypothetical protein